MYRCSVCIHHKGQLFIPGNSFCFTHYLHAGCSALPFE
uniref:Uncharacterized protein n=1 Tax=Anguilla anguilla TaxID=7936 RepID=A0A0E9WH33_ANGAN